MLGRFGRAWQEGKKDRNRQTRKASILLDLGNGSEYPFGSACFPLSGGVVSSQLEIHEMPRTCPAYQFAQVFDGTKWYYYHYAVQSIYPACTEPKPCMMILELPNQSAMCFFDPLGKCIDTAFEDASVASVDDPDAIVSDEVKGLERPITPDSVRVHSGPSQNPLAVEVGRYSVEIPAMNGRAARIVVVIEYDVAPKVLDNHSKLRPLNALVAFESYDHLGQRMVGKNFALQGQGVTFEVEGETQRIFALLSN